MASNELDSFISGLSKTSGAGSSSGGVVNPKQEHSEKGQYFVDSNTGQYYFQSGDGEAMAIVPSDEAEANANAGNSGPSANDNQVMLNTGGDQYQTVTIVPSDGNTGEVSYVLIVQQPEDKDKGGPEEAIGVYDFENENDFDDGDEDGIDDKTKIRKLKSSQQVTQAHMCNYCNYTTSKRYLLSRHMKSHSEERPHKCSVCERGFKTLASLQNHVNTHTGTKPHRCKFCDSTFTTSGELVRHVRYRHTHEKPHKCSECDYQSVELSKLKRHMRCHTGERPYQCSHCTYASPDTFKLKRHLRIHTGEKPYECDICHARFTQSNSLKAHRLIHTGDKPVFQCELCPTTCGRKTDLRLHVQKLHTSERALHCKMCGKSFPDRYTLKVHKKTHEGEKCFKCDLCPYSSISQRHLESHMLIHTDQKPFQCDACDQSFRQKQLLKRHQNLYHNPNYVPPQPKEKTHECPECQRTFRHKGNLIRHMALHDPESTEQEKAMALKIGRQKKIQIIDGQQVEVLTGDDEDDEEEYDEEELEDEDDLIEQSEPDEAVVGAGVEQKMMAVEGQDGQQYVVLEVIQLPENSGAGNNTNATVKVESKSPIQAAKNPSISTGGPPAAKKARVDSEKKQADLASAFGFDDDDEDE